MSAAGMVQWLNGGSAGRGTDLMDLDLIVRTSGRASKDLQAEVIRELNPADLALLEVERGIKPNAIKRLRDSHHAVAKSLAAGMKPAAVSAATGYSLSRISILQGDPAFQELLAHYASLREDAFIDVQQRLALLNVDAIEELRTRLEDEPEKIDVETLLDMVKVLSDRTGNGPASKSTNVNVNLDLSERIRRGRERVLQHVSGGTQGLLTGPSADREGVPAPSTPSEGE